MLCLAGLAFGQEVEDAGERYRIRGPHLGVGVGQDLGGIVGARLSYWPIPHVGAFIGGGWADVAAAYSTGVELRAPTGGRWSPFVVAMYGVNGSIRVNGKEHLNETYYGPSVGVGAMLRQRITRNYWRFSVNLPFRPQEMEGDWNAVQARTDVETRAEAWPISIGVGLHLCLAKRPTPRS